VKYQIIIDYDSETGNRQITGLGNDMVIELGMVYWADVKLRRMIAEGELVERMKAQPRIIGGIPPHG
jgi:hypothetical protein